MRVLNSRETNCFFTYYKRKIFGSEKKFKQKMLKILKSGRDGFLSLIPPETNLRTFSRYLLPQIYSLWAHVIRSR